MHNVLRVFKKKNETKDEPDTFTYAAMLEDGTVEVIDTLSREFNYAHVYDTPTNNVQGAGRAGVGGCVCLHDHPSAPMPKAARIGKCNWAASTHHISAVSKAVENVKIGDRFKT